ncbi:hypothetical protein JCM3770_000444 [Rhodotorula araucariae]
MVQPLVSSAHIAQQLLNASTSSRPPSRPRSFSATRKHAAVNDDYDDSASDLDYSDGSDDDGASLVEERFLDPISPEAIFMKAIAYSRVLSPIGHKFALDMPLRVLAVATGFTESLSGDIHTLRALDGTRELAISHSRLTLADAEEVAASLARRTREYSPSPELPPEQAFRALSLSDDHTFAPSSNADHATPLETVAHRIPPATVDPLAASGTATPAERAAHEAASARAFGSALLSNLSSRAGTPARTRSPSPASASAPASRVRPVATTQTREELLEWYQFTAAGQHRHRTALDRLLEGVQAAQTVSGGGEAVEDALPRPPVSLAHEGGAPTLRVAAQGGEELVFELGEEEEVEEEAEGADDADAEAAEHERDEVERSQAARRRLARRELVGR